MNSTEETKKTGDEAVNATAAEPKPEKEDKKAKKKAKDEELLARIEELEKKLSEADDKYLRMAAEYDINIPPRQSQIRRRGSCPLPLRYGGNL